MTLLSRHLTINETEKSRVVVLDADQPPDALQASIARIVEEFLDRRSEPHGR